MKTYTVNIGWDDFAEEYILPIPEEIIQELGWGLGDIVEWIDNKDGSWTLRRIEHA